MRDLKKNKTMTLLFLFPKPCLSNNLQCALQQSRNQAGHRFLLSYQNIEVEFIITSKLPHPLCTPTSAECSCCYHMRVLALLERGGGEWVRTLERVETRTSSGKPYLPGVERSRYNISSLPHE